VKVQVSVTKLFRYNPAFLFQTAHSNRYVRSHHEHARWEHEKVAVPSPRPSHFLRPAAQTPHTVRRRPSCPPAQFGAQTGKESPKRRPCQKV